MPTEMTEDQIVARHARRTAYQRGWYDRNREKWNQYRRDRRAAAKAALLAAKLEAHKQKMAELYQVYGKKPLSA